MCYLNKKKKASIFSSLPNFTRAGKETFISKIPLTDKTQLLLLQLIKTLSRILLWDFFVFFFLKTLESEFLEAVFFFWRLWVELWRERQGVLAMETQVTWTKNPGKWSANEWLGAEASQEWKNRISKWTGESSGPCIVPYRIESRVLIISWFQIVQFFYLFVIIYLFNFWLQIREMIWRDTIWIGLILWLRKLKTCINLVNLIFFYSLQNLFLFLKLI